MTGEMSKWELAWTRRLLLHARRVDPLVDQFWHAVLWHSSWDAQRLFAVLYAARWSDEELAGITNFGSKGRDWLRSQIPSTETAE